MKTAALNLQFFKAEVFLKDPGDVRREALLGEQFLPGVERFVQSRADEKCWRFC
ncbi:MAG: hypothetical protein WDN00_10490 [Limisphaerales bacterium]